jgi:hypothetical protein
MDILIPGRASQVPDWGRQLPRRCVATGKGRRRTTADVALAEAARLYRGIDTDRARDDVSARTTSDRTRGLQVKAQCGREARRRTVVVYLFFPKMKESASLSQGVVFVSRFDDWYHVWQVAH